MLRLLFLALAWSGLPACIHAAAGAVDISAPPKEKKPQRKAPANHASLLAPQAPQHHAPAPVKPPRKPLPGRLNE